MSVRPDMSISNRRRRGRRGATVGPAVPADAHALGALRDAEPTPFWLDQEGAPTPSAALTGADDCDLAVVGAGFTGLWAALQAKERDPGADVVVLDAGVIAGQASGRNGGICMASLTHGVAQGADAFPGEEARLIELGMENFDEIAQTTARCRIACGWERTGEFDIASAPWQVEGLAEERDHYARVGLGHEWLEREALQAEIHSPTYEAGLWHHDAAIVDPARLAWGLARACAEMGVRFHERTPVTELRRAAAGVELRTPWGLLRARRAILATNAFKPLLRRLRLSVVPVYDYVLMTEPLTPSQLDAIGWSRRQALADAGSTGPAKEFDFTVAAAPGVTPKVIQAVDSYPADTQFLKPGDQVALKLSAKAGSWAPQGASGQLPNAKPATSGATTTVLYTAKKSGVATPLLIAEATGGWPNQAYAFSAVVGKGTAPKTVLAAEHRVAQSVQLSAGDTFMLELPGNASTGSTWAVSPLAVDTVIEPVGDIVFSAGSSDLMGAPGVFTAHFKAVAAGSVPLIMLYQGPGSNAPLGGMWMTMVTVQ